MYITLRRSRVGLQVLEAWRTLSRGGVEIEWEEEEEDWRWRSDGRAYELAQ